MEQLEGRVAVITGGASGIGLATARRLAREGMKLVLADVEPDALRKAEQELAGTGAEVLAVPTDVGELGDLRRLAERTFERFGAAHLLFNNAGVAVAGPMHEMTHQDWEWLVRVNLWGVVHGIEVFVPRMIAQQEGHVISTSSFAGLVPNLGLGVYCATKYAVVGLSEVLRRELEPHGIGVSVLCPMRVETNIGTSERNRPARLAASGVRPAPADVVAGQAPAGSVIKVEEVAERVLRAVRRNELYVLTHPESRRSIRRRFERIDAAFES